MKRRLFLFKSFRVKLMFFFILAMVFIAGASDFLIHRYALHSQFGQLRDKLMAIARVSAVNVDVQKLLEIPLKKEAVASEQYKIVTEELARIKSVVPSIKYMYILAKTGKPGMLKFIVDIQAQDSKDSLTLSYPGDDYDASPFPEMLNGFSGPSADRKLTEDKWGVFLSGYAPIRDKIGQAVAILGVDMSAQDVYNSQKEINQRALLVLILSIVLALVLGFFMSAGVSRQVAELVKGAERLAKGDLDYKVLVKGADEISRLANLFNKMSADLKVYIKELQRTTAEKERLVREIEIAQGIQKSFLPDSAPEIKGIDIAALTLPARIVGGDFYDFIPIEKDKWGLAIADVSGKGVPAALFMALSRALMRASAALTLSPSEAVKHANDLIMRDSKTNMFVTLFYAVLDAITMTFKYVSAGHNPAIMITDTGNDIVLLKAEAAPLGIIADLVVQTQELSLKKGDIILLYTDGVTEALNEKGEQFEIEGLQKSLIENRCLTAKEIVSKIEKEVALFVGDHPQADDITLMIIKAI